MRAELALPALCLRGDTPGGCASWQTLLEASPVLTSREGVITRYCGRQEETFSLLYSGTPSQKRFPCGNYSTDAVSPGSGSPFAVAEMNGAECQESSPRFGLAIAWLIRNPFNKGIVCSSARQGCAEQGVTAESSPCLLLELQGCPQRSLDPRRLLVPCLNCIVSSSEQEPRSPWCCKARRWVFTHFIAFSAGFTEVMCNLQDAPSLSWVSSRLRLRPLVDNAQTSECVCGAEVS